MRIVIEDDKEPTIEGAHAAIAAGEVVDAGPAPTALIRQFAPELVVEQEQDEKAEKPRRPRGKAETPANPLRAGAAVARRRGGAQTAEPQAGKASEGGGAPKRRSTKKS